MKRSPTTLTSPTPPSGALALALAAALLTACGGADIVPPVGQTAADAAGQAAASATVTPATDPVAPLLDDEGQPVPSPATARDGTGRPLAVASVAQATMLMHGRPHGVVQVRVDERGDETVERDGKLIARGPGAAAGFEAEAMVLVVAADLPRATAVAQRLLADGQPQVWVVAQ